MSYQQVIDGQVNPEVPINENMAALGQDFLWAHDVTADTGLTVGLSGGDFDGNAVADSTVSCTNNATNYIVVHRTTRVASVSTGTTNWNTTGTYGRVARAVFASGVLTFHDERCSMGGIFDHAAALGAGDVVGPGGATSGNLAVFSGTTGKLLADGGAPPTGTNTGDETAASIATIGHGVSTKATPVDADEMNLLDSAAAFALKRFTFTNLKAFLKTYFDGLYTASGTSGDVSGPGSSTNGNVAVFSGATGKVIADSGLALSGTNTGDETGARVASLLHAASNKTTLVDADEVNGTDSASSFSLIRTTWTNVKAFLKTYFDTLYLPVAPSIDTSLGSTSGTVVIDLSLIKNGGIVRFTANGNVTALRLSNGTDGKRFTIEITQDGTGSRTVALDGTYFKYGTDITSFTATTTASKKDRLGCYCTGATTADLVAVAKGF